MLPPPLNASKALLIWDVTQCYWSCSDEHTARYSTNSILIQRKYSRTKMYLDYTQKHMFLFKQGLLTSLKANQISIKQEFSYGLHYPMNNHEPVWVQYQKNSMHELIENLWNSFIPWGRKTNSAQTGLFKWSLCSLATMLALAGQQHKKLVELIFWIISMQMNTHTLQIEQPAVHHLQACWCHECQ